MTDSPVYHNCVQALHPRPSPTSMETLLPVCSPAAAISFSCRPSGNPSAVSLLRNFYAPRGKLLLGRHPFRSAGFRIPSSSSSSSSSNGNLGPRDSDAVEVIAIGSRKDAFIDFCLDSPFTASARLRFWTIHVTDSVKVQLSQKSSGRENLLEDLEFLLTLHPCPAAIVLVASAGLDRDHLAALKLLNAIKSAGGLAAAVLLRPFSFEGQRRHLEVDDLLKKLQDCSIFYTVVEADALLRTEMETLAEALKSSNNAVLLAINAISVLASETSQKFIVAPNEQIKELKVSEALKLLESHNEMKVGIGAGYNVKSSITQAALHCPFLDGGLKCLNGTVILTLSRSYQMERNDLSAIVRAFRWITGFQGDIIFSGVHEPDLEPNLVVSTLFILGCNEPSIYPRKSFLSSLAFHFNFLSSFLKREHSEQDDLSVYSSPEGSLTIFDVPEMSNSTAGDLELYVEELEMEPCGENKKSINGSSECSSKPLSMFTNNESEESSGLQGEQGSSWTVGPGLHIAQVWAKERAALSGNMPRAMKSNVFSLPVGVKSFAESSDISQSYNPLDAGTSDHASGESLASTFSRGKCFDVPRKRGQLSARAELMLETEREREKSWTPTLQMQYRGGTYRGRCQGGLPEGKGRLIFTDGSFYDGMWRGGRRSGLGTFCYSNGDVLQGAWRDDLMHGKGWFYFHTGDRWFVNFWKGKANGEGRFYSKSGSIFFGHFRDGWRHGLGISIDADGTRWSETWEDGVLVKRTKLDS